MRKVEVEALGQDNCLFGVNSCNPQAFGKSNQYKADLASLLYKLRESCFVCVFFFKISFEVSMDIF